MSIAHSPNLVSNGLIFLADGKNIKSYPGSGTTVTDIIGSLSGTMTSTTYTGGYFSFTNGSGFNASQYINFGNQTSTLIKPGGFTAMCLVNNTADLAPGTPSYHRNIPFACGNDASLGGWAFERFVGASYWTFRVKFDQDPLYGSEYSFGTNSVSQGNWQHLTAVWDSDTSSMKRYINGQLVATTTLASRTLTSASAQPMVIGASATIYGFNGYFSQGMFYNRPLSDNEVRQSFNAVRVRFGL
jgi:hypothetical protein